MIQGASLEIEGVRQRPFAGAIGLTEIQVTLMGRSVKLSADSFRFRSLGSRAASLAALFETVAVPVQLQDVHSVGQTIQQRSGQTFRSQDLGPLIKGQIRGDYRRAPLLALAEDLEQQFRPGLGQGHEAQFIDDQQFQRGQTLLHLQQASFFPGFHEFMDQG